MKKIFIVFGAILLLSSTSSAAEYESWYLEALKKENSNELGYYLFVEKACPFNAKDAVEKIEGVFIRSRIKPQKDIFVDEEVYLSLSITCLNVPKFNTDAFVYVTKADFGRYTPKPAVTFTTDKEALFYGLGNKDKILDTLKEMTEMALIPYLKANFNL